MQFLTLYTPAASAGAPDAQHRAQMGQLIEEMLRAGVLVATGGIKSRSTGMKVTRRNGTVSIEEGPVAGSSLMAAAGFALLRASSRAELVTHIERFLELAGDGVSEIIEVMESPPPKT